MVLTRGSSQITAHLQQCPPEILSCLESGGFAVNITGRFWHCVALNEAHEMCISKDLKTAVVRPTNACLQMTSLFFQYRIVAYKNLIQQLFPERFIQDAATTKKKVHESKQDKHNEKKH